jgi:hypothetical protein
VFARPNSQGDIFSVFWTNPDMPSECQDATEMIFGEDSDEDDEIDEEECGSHRGGRDSFSCARLLFVNMHVKRPLERYAPAAGA